MKSFSFKNQELMTFHTSWSSALAVIAACLALAGTAQLAPAIAPSDQVVPDANLINPDPDDPNYSLYSIVDITQNSDGTGTSGTGSIIDTYVSNNVDYAYVLTADHVADIGGYKNYVGIGVNNGSWTHGYPAGFQETLVATGGPNTNTYFEDIAIMRVTLGAQATASALFDSITPLNVANPFLMATTNGQQITEYGYGLTGNAGTFGGTAGYSSTSVPYYLRFQNNTVLNITAIGDAGYKDVPDSLNPTNYSEPLLNWKVVAPANNNLSGTSFGGDSGGPYLTTSSTLIPVTRNGIIISNYNEQTDYIDAIHVLGYDPSLNGQTNSGVYIDQANYNWIMTQIPEPSTLALAVTALCVAGACVAGFSSRRKF